MNAANTIDSGTSTTHRFVWKDEDGNLQVPTAVFITLLSVTPPRVVRAETAETDLAPTMDVDVTEVENTAISGLPTEDRRIVARATFLEGQLVVDQLYRIKKVLL